MPNRKIFMHMKAMLCISASWSRIVLGGILGVSVCLAVLGCASLGRMAPNETGGETTPETPKSLAYYHFLKAQQLLVADDAAGAIQEYEAAIKDDPESPFLEMELAALYQRQGDVKQALAHAEKSLRLDPKQQEAYFLLASLHVGLNQLDEATREYERILTLDPKNREARLFLATLYAQQRRYPKAIRTVQELLRLDPSLVVGYYYLGRIYLETGRLADAKKEFQRVLTMDPKFVPAMFDLGVTLEREHQYSRALSMYRRILRAYPRNSKVWTSIGRLYLIMNRYSDAQKAFRKVRELERNDPAADFNIALICLEQKLPDDAIRLFRPLLSRAPLPGTGSLLHRHGPGGKRRPEGGRDRVSTGRPGTPNILSRRASGWPISPFKWVTKSEPGRSSTIS